QTSHDMKAKGRQLRLPHGQTGNNQTFKNKTRRKNRRVCQRSEPGKVPGFFMPEPIAWPREWFAIDRPGTNSYYLPIDGGR
ncbi:hypothetical protein, partial [Rhizobium sp. GCM10022189]|uniref:hypothetical protein n=1 Tax=Rhizobium sp. GCM10022189 TaxID=3252654 RepID=UPI003618449D